MLNSKGGNKIMKLFLHLQNWKGKFPWWRNLTKHLTYYSFFWRERSPWRPPHTRPKDGKTQHHKTFDPYDGKKIRVTNGHMHRERESGSSIFLAKKLQCLQSHLQRMYNEQKDAIGHQWSETSFCSGHPGTLTFSEVAIHKWIPSAISGIAAGNIANFIYSWPFLKLWELVTS